MVVGLYKKKQYGYFSLELMSGNFSPNYINIDK